MLPKPSFSSLSDEVSEATLEKWQHIADLLAQITGVPAALVMRIHPQEIEVFISSESEGNPYEQGDTHHLDAGLYCETVIETEAELLVKNALADPDWDDNPDIKLNMISYLGYPLLWPDGQVFGTLCVLDAQPNAYNEMVKRLMQQFSQTLETDLRLEASLAELRRYRSIVSSSNDGLALVNADYKYEIVNDVYVTSTGKDRDEIVGHPVSELVGEEVFAQIKPRFDRCFQGETFQYEQQFSTPHGSGYFDTTYSPYRDHAGNIVGAVVSWHDITDRKAVEEEIREREEAYRALAENSPDFISRLTRDGTHLYVNQAFAASLGMTQEELTGKANADLGVLPEASREFDALREAVFTTGKAQRLEFTYNIKGNDRHYETVAAPEFDQNGNVVSIVTVTRDITDRKAMEEEIRKREEAYRALADNSPDFITRLARDSTHLYVNPSLAESLGMTQEELTGKANADLGVPPEASREFDALREAVFTTGKVQQLEFTYNIKGRDRHYETVAAPEFDQTGNVVSIVTVTRDITDRKRAEQAIRQEEAKLRALINNTEDYIWSIDTDYRLVSFNETVRRSAKRHYGVDSQPGMSVFAHGSPELHALYRPYYERALAGEQAQFEYSNTVNGHTYYSLVSMSPITLDDGTIVGATVYIRDITTHKQAQETAMQLELEHQRVAMLSDFIQQAHHHFRTPLTVLKTNLFLLDRITDLAKRQTKMEQMKAAVARIQRLVGRLLLITSLDSQEPAEWKAVQVANLVENASQHVQKRYESQLSFTTSVDLNLPKLWGDEQLLFTVLVELLDNAYRLTPPEGQVHVTARFDDDNVILMIEDTGPGIPAEEIAPIFDTLYGQMEDPYSSGFGLGLALVQRIVAHHKGYIEVSSQEGDGAVFTIRLPGYPADDAAR